jgi:hypothetical protein
MRTSLRSIGHNLNRSTKLSCKVAAVKYLG